MCQVGIRANKSEPLQSSVGSINENERMTRYRHRKKIPRVLEAPEAWACGVGVWGVVERWEGVTWMELQPSV